MKKLLLIPVSGLLLTSCFKNLLKDDNTFIVNYKIETSFEEMTLITDQAVAGNLVYYKSGQAIFVTPGYKPSNEKTPCSVVITHDTLTYPRTITVDYGTDNCDCNDGKKRRGKIVTSYSGPYLLPGTVITHTPVDYYVNDVKIDGTKTVENMGTTGEGQPYFNVQIDGSATLTSGEVVTYTSTRVRKWSEGYNTPTNRLDDVFDITGTAVAAFANGGGYEAGTTTPIRVKVGCSFPVSGKIDITPSGKPTRSVDYGDGTCDFKFTVTINGRTYNFNFG